MCPVCEVFAIRGKARWCVPPSFYQRYMSLGMKFWIPWQKARWCVLVISFGVCGCLGFRNLAEIGILSLSVLRVIPVHHHVSYISYTVRPGSLLLPKQRLRPLPHHQPLPPFAPKELTTSPLQCPSSPSDPPPHHPHPPPPQKPHSNSPFSTSAHPYPIHSAPPPAHSDDETTSKTQSP